MNNIKYIMVYLFLVIINIPVRGQYMGGDEMPGMKVVDSIVNSMHIKSADNYFERNINGLDSLFSSEHKDVNAFKFVNFLGIYTDMSRCDGMRWYPYWMLSYQDLMEIKEWYRKNKSKITLSMLEDFLRNYYNMLLSDKDAEEIRKKLIPYYKILGSE